MRLIPFTRRRCCPDPDEFHGTLRSRLGHHASTLLILSICAAVAMGLHPLPGVAAFAGPLLLMALVLVIWSAMRRHDRRLCEHCAAAIPLNPAARAQSIRHRFRLAHAGGQPRLLLPYFALLVGANFLPGTPGRIVWAAVTLSLAYLILSYTSHRKLQPWCPQCSGGGGSELVETPPVLPHDDRQLA